MTDWSAQVSRTGVEHWKKMALAHAEGWEDRRAEYERWAQTPRGRITIMKRRLRALPYRMRYSLAALIFPGDLDERY